METSFKNILVLTDFSKKSLNAVQTAIGVAHRHQAILHLLQVRSVDLNHSVGGMVSPISVYREPELDHDAAILDGMAAGIRKEHGIECLYHQETGPDSSVICANAKKLGADLIVVGTPANLQQSSFLYDSLAYRLARNAPCAVLTIPAEKKINSFKNILFPVRQSKNARAKYLSSRPVLLKSKATVTIMGLITEQSNGAARSIHKMVDQARDWLKKDQLDFTSGVQFNEDEAANAIEAGREQHADLIVISSPEQRSFWEFFTGSYTQRLIRNPGYAVLITRA